MSTITEYVDREVVRCLVQREITCPRTGDVLDVRTCVVLRDSDGDPVAVVSQDGWAAIVNDGGDAILKKTHGLTVDESTVKA